MPLVNKSKQTQQSAADPDPKRTVTTNRKARHEYTIVETYDAGLALAGTEVKSVRGGGANMADSFAKVENGEVWLHNMHISPYDHGTRWNMEPRRSRKLLLHRREIDRMQSQADRKGYAIVPLSIYFQRGFAKVELGLGIGKKLYDKRDAIADRDVERDRQRELQQRTRSHDRD